MRLDMPPPILGKSRVFHSLMNDQKNGEEYKQAPRTPLKHLFVRTLIVAEPLEPLEPKLFYLFHDIPVLS